MTCPFDTVAVDGKNYFNATAMSALMQLCAHAEDCASVCVCVSVYFCFHEFLSAYGNRNR